MAIVEGAIALRDESSLIRRLAQGDEDAARELMRAHGDALFRFIRRRVSGSIEDAEEIVQDTFATAVELAPTYDGTCQPLTWLCSLARLMIRTHLKKNAQGNRTFFRNALSLDDESRLAVRSVHDPSASVEELVDRMDRVRMVQALLDTLSIEQREAVTMRYVEQFSIPEIARVMNRSEKAVEKLLERAKERPRREMLRWLGEESFRMLCFEVIVI